MSIASCQKFINLDTWWILATQLLGITQSKLDDCILDSEIQIDNYQVLRCDRNRKGGGVAYCVRNDLSYIAKNFFPEGIENIFFEILLPKTKSINVGIIYWPPKQNNFLQTLNENFAKLDTLKKELYIHSWWLQYKLVSKSKSYRMPKQSCVSDSL